VSGMGERRRTHPALGANQKGVSMSEAATVAKLHHVIAGQGPWVTLVHSLSADHTLLAPQAARLAENFSVLSLDIRGHGKSEIAASPYTMGALAEDVAALLASKGIASTHWVGISLGGMIGLTLALAHPGLVRSLVLADTTAGYPPAAHAAWRERIAIVRAKGMVGVREGTLGRWLTQAFRARDPETTARVGAMIAATPVEGFVGSCEAIIGYDVSARLAEIACPTLVLVGEEDEATPPAMAEALALGIRGAVLRRIPNAAHQSSTEQPALFNTAMAEFLAHAG
jgi:3-oxoadipate enol-lactonase